MLAYLQTRAYYHRGDQVEHEGLQAPGEPLDGVAHAHHPHHLLKLGAIHSILNPLPNTTHLEPHLLLPYDVLDQQRAGHHPGEDVQQRQKDLHVEGVGVHAGEGLLLGLDPRRDSLVGEKMDDGPVDGLLQSLWFRC